MAAQELRWLTYLLTDLGEPPRSPPVLYVDNKAMLALCREHRLEHRTKHIALRYFLARELQQRGQLRLAYVASQANTADIFTKELQPCDHQRFYTMLAVSVVLSSLPFAAAGSSLLGGWSAVQGAAKSQEVKKLASFAVNAHNKKEGTGLKLVSVESAKSQVVAGVNWSITLKATAVAPVARRLGHRRASPPATTTYVAEVFQSLTPVDGEPTVEAQRAGTAQPVGNGQAAVGNGQPVVSNERPVVDVQQSGVAKPVLAREPVLADYLVLVSFTKKS
ncbi:unnamed protein product [Closterium sp. NIES-54]